MVSSPSKNASKPKTHRIIQPKPLISLRKESLTHRGTNRFKLEDTHHEQTEHSPSMTAKDFEEVILNMKGGKVRHAPAGIVSGSVEFVSPLNIL